MTTHRRRRARGHHGAGRKILVLMVGLTLVGAGAALLVLPGPGLLVMLGGLAVLGTEFEMARRAQRRVTVKARQTTARLRGSSARDAVTIPPSQHAPAAGGIEPPLSPPR